MEWEGQGPKVRILTGTSLWEESWVSITYLSKDLREEARKLRKASYLVQQCSNMELTAYEIGREGRLRNPARQQLSSRNQGRGLTGGFHQFQHSRC